MKRSVLLAIPLLFIYGSTLVLAMNMTPLQIPSFAYRMAISTVSGSALVCAMLMMMKSDHESMRIARLHNGQGALKHRNWYSLATLFYVVAFAMLMLAQMVPRVIESLVIGGIVGVMFGLGTACAHNGRLERMST